MRPVRYLLSSSTKDRALEELADDLAQQIAGSSLCGRVILEVHDEALVLELKDLQRAEAQAVLKQWDGNLQLSSESELLGAIEPLIQSTHNPDALDLTALTAGREALFGLAALLHSDLRLLDILRRLAEHLRSEVRAGVIAAASRIGYRLFLLELWAKESDPTLQRILATVTAFERGQER